MKKVLQQNDLKGLIETIYTDGTREVKYDLLPHQKKFLKMKDKIVYFRAGRGAGKTFIAAELAVKELLHQRKAICLAQNFGALSSVLEPEVYRQLSIIIPGQFKYNQQKHRFTYGNGIIYLGSYEAIESIRGYTSISLAILDELARAPSSEVFTILSFCMRDCPVTPKIRMMSTPRSSNWLTRFVQERKIPIVTAITSDNTRISEEEIELMRSTCPDENSWRREFYGEEVEDNSSGLIFSTALLSTAGKTVVKKTRGFCIGIDCSGLGKDSNVILVRDESSILEIVEKTISSNSELCSIVKGLVMKYGEENLSHICIDEAYGIDLAERLEEAGINCTIVPFSGRPENDAYANNRAEMYFNLKKGIEENGLRGITDELFRELQATKYKLNSANKIQIINKDEIKLNLGRSPDIADALALTYYQEIVPMELIELERERQNQHMI